MEGWQVECEHFKHASSNISIHWVIKTFSLWFAHQVLFIGISFICTRLVQLNRMWWSFLVGFAGESCQNVHNILYRVGPPPSVIELMIGSKSVAHTISPPYCDTSIIWRISCQPNTLVLLYPHIRIMMFVLWHSLGPFCRVMEVINVYKWWAHINGMLWD